MPGPIRPKDVTALKAAQIPEEVFEVFNGLIARNWDGYAATVRQDEVVRLLMERGIDRARVFSEHMLDVEEAYRAAGWTVSYDRPGYNEDYPSTFNFRKRSGR
jgi:hypothetical protein